MRACSRKRPATLIMRTFSLMPGSPLREAARALGIDVENRFEAFEAESLDGVCAYSILHLVEDRPAALEQIFRLLKPGGFFVSSTVCLGESWVPYGPLIGAMRLIGKAPMVQIFDKHTLEDEIRESGFVDISQPDVGAKGEIAFIVARKSQQTCTAAPDPAPRAPTDVPSRFAADIDGFIE